MGVLKDWNMALLILDKPDSVLRNLLTVLLWIVTRFSPPVASSFNPSDFLSEHSKAAYALSDGQG